MTGVTAIMAGMSGGGDVVTLVGANELELAVAPTTAAAGYRLTSGGLEESGVGPVGSIVYGTIGNWVTPTGSASLYEVRATLNSGTLSTGTTGVWLALTSTRTWTVEQSIVGVRSANLTIEIRLAGGPGTILASAEVDLSAEVTP